MLISIDFRRNNRSRFKLRHAVLLNPFGNLANRGARAIAFGSNNVLICFVGASEKIERRD